jgi:hypothetical protein
MSPESDADARHVQVLASLVFKDLETAASSLPEEERKAYHDARSSVVEARRNAETKEGLLRIN